MIAYGIYGLFSGLSAFILFQTMTIIGKKLYVEIPRDVSMISKR